jgi:O-antigen ligase
LSDATAAVRPGRDELRTRGNTRLVPILRDALLPVYIVLALALGGGGSPSPLPEMLLEWVALTLLAVALWLKPEAAPWPRLALGFAGALLAVPALQLMPLPPGVWQALPGRAIEASALELAGAGERWMPLSVSPPRTLASLLAMIVPAAGLIVAALASPRGRALGVFAVAVMALVSVAVGVVQLAQGPHSAFRFYAASHVEDLTGFQANRNAEADVLLIGLVALGALVWGLPARWRREGRIGAALVAVILAAGVVLTASRMGVLLLAVVAVAAVVGVGLRFRAQLAGGRGRAMTFAVLAIAAAAAWLAAAGSAPSRIAARFSERAGEARPEIWSDTLYAIGQYWPWGSGIGTFVPVFLAAERLEAVDPSYPNRAHNDFLELALEAGLPGIAVLLVLSALLVWRMATRLRHVRSLEDRAQLGFAGAVLGLVAVHSIVDYPLRSMALAAVVGAACGLILAAARQSGGAAPPGRVETRSA